MLSIPDDVSVSLVGWARSCPDMLSFAMHRQITEGARSRQLMPAGASCNQFGGEAAAAISRDGLLQQSDSQAFDRNHVPYSGQ